MIKLTTNQGTNALAILAAIYEVGGANIPAQHHEIFAYVMVAAMILILWLTKGSHPDDGVPIDEPELASEGKPRRTLEDVLREGRK